MKSITRRAFLRTSAITAIGAGLGSPLLGRTAFGGTRSLRGTATDPIVVLVNMFGGNDFLNTVVPLGQFDRYRSMRPMLHIPRERTLSLPGTTDIGFNPGMTALRDIYADGRLAVVLGTGMPMNSQGLFDHEASQLNLQAGHTSGSAFESAPSGWIGRWLDTVGAGIAPPGVNVGGYSTLALAGEERDALTVFDVSNFGVMPYFDTEARLASYKRIQAESSSLVEPAMRGREMRQLVVDLGDTLRERTEAYVPAVDYPEDNNVAYTLRQCAQLIDADLGVRALAVAADGYDTHASQNDGASNSSLGYHDYLLMQVSNAIGAFLADVAAHGHGNRVVVVVASEFGRRCFENTDIGTDHGYAGGMFVAGEPVVGGIYGEYPSLADSDLVLDGNIDVTTDFRSVYATVLAGHLGADPGDILNGNFPTLGFL